MRSQRMDASVRIADINYTNQRPDQDATLAHQNLTCCHPIKVRIDPQLDQSTLLPCLVASPAIFYSNNGRQKYP